MVFSLLNHGERGGQGMRRVCGEKGDTYSVLEEKTERKTNLQNLGLDRMIILKLIFKA
jgi:hypothetical protein